MPVSVREVIAETTSKTQDRVLAHEPERGSL